jgi:phage shock protein A
MTEEGRPRRSEPPRPATPQSASSAGPPSAPPPPDRSERRLPDDQRPATAQQFKSLRRWLIVAGVWAVAATGLAVFALIEADQAEEAAGEQATGQAGRVQRQLDSRIDDLESRIDELPTSDDVSKLDDRLAKVEDDLSKTTQDVTRLNRRIEDLEGRVDDLEQAAEAGADTNTNTETTP